MHRVDQALSILSLSEAQDGYDVTNGRVPVTVCAKVRDEQGKVCKAHQAERFETGTVSFFGSRESRRSRQAPVTMALSATLKSGQ